MTVPVITGLDLPANAAGGSVELFYDLYAAPAAALPAQAFMLAPAGAGTARPAGSGLKVATVGGKCLDGPPFRRYITALATAISAALTPQDGAVLHLQHLTFGASPALLTAFPDLPAIALVHGTDLLHAAEHPTQRRVLAQVTRTATVIVVPTTAMADHLRRLAPDLDPRRVAHIPWGIPDRLLATPPPPRPRHDGVLRLLYAGRLTAEKGAGPLIAACADVPGIRLSIAAPRSEYTALRQQVDIVGVTYLGWLERPRLWQAFVDQDLLLAPSTTLEAFGLVAVEAQACGLPVAYHSVPGLREVLDGSALTVDLSAPAAFAADLAWLRNDPAALHDLRAAGLANAARYPLTATARHLEALARQLT